MREQFKKLNYDNNRKLSKNHWQSACDYIYIQSLNVNYSQKVDINKRTFKKVIIIMIKPFKACHLYSAMAGYYFAIKQLYINILKIKNNNKKTRSKK